MNNLFEQIKNNVTIATESTVRTPMTKDEVEHLKLKLKKIMALNVYPNQFDITVPYHVSTRFNKEVQSHGNFVNLEVAKMVGNIASLALFGVKAQASKIEDMDAVQADPEMVEWMNDERNKTTIAKASLVYN